MNMRAIAYKIKKKQPWGLVHNHKIVIEKPRVKKLEEMILV